MFVSLSLCHSFPCFVYFIFIVKLTNVLKFITSKNRETETEKERTDVKKAFLRSITMYIYAHCWCRMNAFVVKIYHENVINSANCAPTTNETKSPSYCYHRPLYTTHTLSLSHCAVLFHYSALFTNNNVILLHCLEYTLSSSEASHTIYV